MNKIFKSTLLPSACGGLALLFVATAQAQQYPWYLKADVGGNVTVDTDLKEFFGPVTSGSKVKFDPGFRAGFAGGYFLTDWFAAEGEIGVMANNISSISEADSVDAVYSNIPFLVNARFQCPRGGFVTPYFGGGLGGSFAVMDANHIRLNDTSFDGVMTSVVFAYQAFAGLRFKINDSMGLSVEYRYFATESPDWRAEVAINTDTDRLRIAGTQTHAVSVAFDWRF